VPTSPTERRYDIDVVRVFAFALLILYHVGMLYVAGWDWHLKSAHEAPWLRGPMLAVNRWRMELLFVVSGLAVNVLRRGAAGTALGILRTRTWRLLVPLVFGMAVVVPLQPYVQMVTEGLIPADFWQFLVRYFTGYRWPAGAFPGSEAHFTWNHLWYLAYLWVYTAVLAALTPVLESRLGQRLRAAVLNLRGVPLLVVPACVLTLWAELLQSRFPETHALAGDWFLHAIYFSCFLYGYWLGRSPEAWAEITQLRWQSLHWTLCCGTIYLGVALWGPNDLGPLALAAMRGCRWLYAWCAILAILGWSHYGLNRPFEWLPWAREAVYPWYMLHQTLIIGVAYFLMPLHLGPVVEPLLVLGGTIAGCALLHGGLIRRVRWLRPVFGLPPASAARPPAAARWGPARDQACDTQ
jgi:glucan biosynthesis protein C